MGNFNQFTFFQMAVNSVLKKLQNLSERASAKGLFDSRYLYNPKSFSLFLYLQQSS